MFNVHSDSVGKAQSYFLMLKQMVYVIIILL
jgi:hypothetical protein